MKPIKGVINIKAHLHKTDDESVSLFNTLVENLGSNDEEIKELFSKYGGVKELITNPIYGFEMSTGDYLIISNNNKGTYDFFLLWFSVKNGEHLLNTSIKELKDKVKRNTHKSKNSNVIKSLKFQDGPNVNMYPAYKKGSKIEPDERIYETIDYLKFEKRTWSDYIKSKNINIYILVIAIILAFIFFFINNDAFWGLAVFTITQIINMLAQSIYYINNRDTLRITLDNLNIIEEEEKEEKNPDEFDDPVL